jgi:hypothetical protein
VFKDAIPPDFPEQLKESMNFIFGKNAFFGIAPASDGVFFRRLALSKQVLTGQGDDVVDKLDDT